MQGSVTYEEIERLKRDLSGAQANLNTMLNNVERSAGYRVGEPDRGYGLGSPTIESPMVYGTGTLQKTAQAYVPTSYQTAGPPSYQTVGGPNYQTVGTPSYQTVGRPSYSSNQASTRLTPPPVRITSNTMPAISSTVGATSKQMPMTTRKVV